jgi:hypothetical protein
MIAIVSIIALPMVSLRVCFVDDRIDHPAQIGLDAVVQQGLGGKERISK